MEGKVCEPGLEDGQDVRGDWNRAWTRCGQVVASSQVCWGSLGQSPEAGFWQLVAAPGPLGSLSLAGGHPGEAHRQAWRTARVGGTARDCLKGGSRALLSQDTP